MHGSIYHLRNLIFLPTLARTQDGFFLEIEPVEVLTAPASDGLHAALRRVEERGNPSIRAPSPGSFPPPVVQARAHVRSQRELEPLARHWALEWTANGILLIPTIRAAHGGFLHQPENAEPFAGPGALLRLAERVVQLTGD